MKIFDFFSVRDATVADRDWIRERLAEAWGGPVMAVHGEAIETAGLPALSAGSGRGFLVYRVRLLAAEIVAMEALAPGEGIGTALLAGLETALKKQAVREIWVTTTNDNLDALRFYQRRGFRMEAVRRDAVGQIRHLKPSIPEVGAYGIAVRDEVDLRAAMPLALLPGQPAR